MAKETEVKSLVIGTTSSYSGRTLVCLGMGLRFIRDGLNIGYYKPLGTLPIRVGSAETDEDAVFVAQALGVSAPPELLCPVPLTDALIKKEMKTHSSTFEKKVLEAHEKLKKGKDLMLVGGMGSLIEGRLIHLSGLQLVELLNAKVVIVNRHDTETSCLDHILHMKDQLGDRLIGVILNKVHAEKIPVVEREISPFLKRHGINVLGILPNDSILSSVSVGELRDILDGKIICREDKQDALVEKISIGAMNVESAMKYFEKNENKAVITGGDRLDIQLAAIETSTRCLVLTGDMYPNDIIIHRASERGVSIIMVKTDTLSTIERFESSISKLRIRTHKKIDRAAQLVNNAVDFDTIYNSLGILKR